jgi:putative ABC transport system permease protein
VNLAGLAIKNVARNKGRSALTILGIAAAIILFTLMRTVVAAWTGAQDHAAKDRLVTRHKVTFVMTLPKNYVEEIKKVPGVTAVNYANWFGGKLPKDPDNFFGKIAIDPETILDVYPEIKVPPAQMEAWKAERRGVLVGKALADKYGWKLGDKITIEGDIYPGMWDFLVSGIYESTSPSVDQSSMWMQWSYLNESPATRRKDQIGWLVSRVDDPSRTAEISKAIDQVFDQEDNQTVTMNEKAFQQSFLGMFSAILRAIDVVSLAILAIILLILGNTIAMAVRERTGEYGCLRAIGFQPGHIATFVALESLATGIVGGLLGLGLATLLVDGVLGPFLEANSGGMFPFFRITPMVAVLAVGLAGLMAALAAIVPAVRAARLDVVTALRTVE